MAAQAHQYASDASHDKDSTVPIIIRSLYIQGVTWFLRGLPCDLTPNETLLLQTAMPPTLADVQHDTRVEGTIVRIRNDGVVRSENVGEATVLHRATACLVFNMLMMMQFLLPYLRVLLAQACEYEREHRLTRRLLNTGVSTVDEIGRKGMRLVQSICQLNNGKVGEALNYLVVYSATSVTGGMQQGIEEALRSELLRREQQ